MSIATATLLLMILVLVIGGVAPFARAVLPVLAAIVLVPPALVVTAFPAATFFLALFAFLFFMRTIDLWRDPAAFDLRGRLWHLTALYDTRKSARIERHVPLQEVVAAFAFLVLAASLMVLVVVVRARTSGAIRAVAGGLLAAGMFVATFECLARALPAAWALVGIRPPPAHDQAFLATSVREFWGLRWNKIVGAWLRENASDPFAAKGRPLLGLVAAFVVSGVAHAYLAGVAIGADGALVSAVFFFLQPAFIVAERVLRVSSWSRPVARAWTIGVLCLSSPLFTEPMVVMIEATARAFDLAR